MNSDAFGGDALAEVSALLYREARLLDEERYSEWLALFTPDVHYWVPVIENRSRADLAGPFGPSRMAFFDDDLAGLAQRVARLQAPTAWSENPATRHLHIVSNIEVEPAGPQDPGDVVAYSVVLSHRGHGATGFDTLSGRRRDVMRRTEEGWLIAARRVLITQSMLLAKNFNTFL